MLHRFCKKPLYEVARKMANVAMDHSRDGNAYPWLRMAVCNDSKTQRFLTCPSLLSTWVVSKASTSLSSH